MSDRALPSSSKQILLSTDDLPDAPSPSNLRFGQRNNSPPRADGPLSNLGLGRPAGGLQLSTDDISGFQPQKGMLLNTEGIGQNGGLGVDVVLTPGTPRPPLLSTDALNTIAPARSHLLKSEGSSSPLTPGGGLYSRPMLSTDVLGTISSPPATSRPLLSVDALQTINTSTSNLLSTPEANRVPTPRRQGMDQIRAMKASRTRDASAGSTSNQSSGSPQRRPNKSGSRPESVLMSTASRPADFALERLFKEFERLAMAKVRIILTYPIDKTVDVGQFLRLGVDEQFDRVLSALGTLGKHRPQYTIDLLILWRKRASLKVDAGLAKNSSNVSGNTAVREQDAQAILKDRKSLTMNFVVCRLLNEIVKQITPENLASDLGNQLEEMVFVHIRNAEPESLVVSPYRQTNIDLFAELIGALSRLRFSSMTDRFICEFEKADTMNELKQEIIIVGMRFLEFKLYPMSEFDEAGEFLQSCGNFFAKAHDLRVKHAFAQTFTDLLLPVAATADAEINLPAWGKAIEGLYPKANKLILKPRHFEVAYPLLCAIICASKQEFFSGKWQGFLEMCMQRLKEKVYRSMAMMSICRLVWVYLFRCSEAHANTAKRVDAIFKVFFPPGKKAVFPSEMEQQHDLFVHFVHFCGVRLREHAFRNQLLVLLGYESGGITGLDSLAPERMIIAFRAYVAIMHDLDGATENRPRFPLQRPTLPSGIVPDKPIKYEVKVTNTSSNNFHMAIREVIEKVNDAAGKIVQTIDRSGEGYVVMAESNGRNQWRSSGEFKDKQPLFDLLRAIFEAVPRCQLTGYSEVQLIDLLAKYALHADLSLALAAMEALTRLMRQCLSMQVVIVKTLGQFIIQVPDRYPDQVERALKLYLAVLEVGLDQLRNATDYVKLSNSEYPDFDVVHELEVRGFVFMCHCSPTIRRYGIKLCRLSSSFDMVLQKTLSSDLVKVWRNDINSHEINLLKLVDEIGEILQKEALDSNTTILQENSSSTGTMNTHRRTQSNGNVRPGPAPELPKFTALAQSDKLPDRSLWQRHFLDLIQRLNDRVPQFVLSSVSLLDRRVEPLHVALVSSVTGNEGGSNQNASTGPIPPPRSLATMNSRRTNSSGPITNPTNNSMSFNVSLDEDLIEQWRIYFSVLCMISVDVSASGQQQKHVSTSLSSISVKIMTECLRNSMIYLQCDVTALRTALVTALGHLDWTLYRILFDELVPLMRLVSDDIRQTRLNRLQKRSRRLDLLKCELVHILHLVASFIRHEKYQANESLCAVLLDFVRETKDFLQDPEIVVQWDFVQMRFHFCKFVENYFNHVAESSSVEQWMPFDLRQALFSTFEEWCGQGAHRNMAREREAVMMSQVLEQVRDMRERALKTSLMEEQRQALELSSLNAMAALCKGPLVQLQPGTGRVLRSMDSQAVFQWMNAILTNPDERLHGIARSAMESLLLHNAEQQLSLVDDAVTQCFMGALDQLRVTRNYFTALVNAFSRKVLPCRLSTLLTLVLLKCGDSNAMVRRKAIQLLKSVEEHYFTGSTVSDYDVAVTGSLATTYKQLQVQLSTRLARDHPDLVCEILTETAQRIEIVSRQGQCDLLTVLVPWLRHVELSRNSEDATSALSDASLIMLNNLFHITIKFGDDFVREIETLWSQLTWHESNISLIVSYLLQLGLYKRNPDFVTHANKVIVYLGRTSSRLRLIQELVACIAPRLMVPQHKLPEPRPRQTMGLFVASMETYLPTAPQRNVVFSRGQLAALFMVDLVLEANRDLEMWLPLLLHVAFVQLDHFHAVVFDLSRILLMHLLPLGASSSGLLQYLTSKEGQRLWPYEDISITKLSLTSFQDITRLVERVLDVFSATRSDLRQHWGLIALKWATSCPVRHIACRSLQLFRVLEPAFNQIMVSDMMTRLHNTVADPTEDLQGFSLEILFTMQHMIKKMDRDRLILFPQLFWSSVALLHTNYEMEFLASLQLMELWLERMDLNQESVQEQLMEALPEDQWIPPFQGIQPLVIKGVVLASTEETTLRVLRALTRIRKGPLVDEGPNRLLFLTLAFLPKFLQTEFGNSTNPNSTIWHETAQDLADLANSQNERFQSLGRLFQLFSKQKLRSRDDFIRQIVSILLDTFKVTLSGFALKFLIEILASGPPLSVEALLPVLKQLLPNLDFQQLKDGVQVEEIVTPLLHLMEVQNSVAVLEVLEEMMKRSANQMMGRTEQVATRDAVRLSRQLLAAPIESYSWQHKEDGTRHVRQNIDALIQKSSSSLSQMSAQDLVFSRDAAFTRETSDRVMTVVYQEDNDVLLTAQEERYQQLMSDFQMLDQFFANTPTLQPSNEEILSPNEAEGDTLGGHDLFSDDSEEVLTAASTHAAATNVIASSSRSRHPSFDYGIEPLPAALTEAPTRSSSQERNHKRSPSVERVVEQQRTRRTLSISTIDENAVFLAVDNELPAATAAPNSTKAVQKKRTEPASIQPSTAELLLLPDTFVQLNIPMQKTARFEDVKFQRSFCTDLADLLEMDRNCLSCTPSNGSLIVSLKPSNSSDSSQESNAASYAKFAERYLEYAGRSNAANIFADVSLSAIDLSQKATIQLLWQGVQVPYLPQGLWQRQRRGTEMAISVKSNVPVVSGPASAPVRSRSLSHNSATTLTEPLPIVEAQRWQEMMSRSEWLAKDNFAIFPLSFRLLLALFKDVVQFLKRHLDTIAGNNDDAASKRVKQIVRNLHMLFDSKYKPPIDLDPSLVMQTAQERLKELIQSDPSFVVHFDTSKYDNVHLIDDELSELLSERLVTFDLERQYFTAPSSSAHLKFCQSLAGQCSHLIRLYKCMLDLQALTEDLLNLPPLSKQVQQQKTEQAYEFNAELIEAFKDPS